MSISVSARADRRRKAASKSRCPACRQLWALRVEIQDSEIRIICDICSHHVSTVPRPRRAGDDVLVEGADPPTSSV